MKIMKRLFPFMLVLAITLTGVGLLTINKTYSISDDVTKSLNMYIDKAVSDNITIINHDNTTIAYLINLNDNKDRYALSFEIMNDSSFDMKLNNIVGATLPDELKDIVNVEINRQDEIAKHQYDNVSIKYTIKDNLSLEEKKIISKYNKLKINMIFNYDQV